MANSVNTEGKLECLFSKQEALIWDTLLFGYLYFNFVRTMRGSRFNPFWPAAATSQEQEEDLQGGSAAMGTAANGGSWVRLTIAHFKLMVRQHSCCHRECSNCEPQSISTTE